MIRDFNSKGESREIIKKIADFSTLFVLLKEDLDEYLSQNDH